MALATSKNVTLLKVKVLAIYWALRLVWRFQYQEREKERETLPSLVSVSHLPPPSNTMQSLQNILQASLTSSATLGKTKNPNMFVLCCSNRSPNTLGILPTAGDGTKTL